MKEKIEEHLKFISEKFEDELATDENQDYRRGYYAGVLHAFLLAKNLFNDYEK